MRWVGNLVITVLILSGLMSLDDGSLTMASYITDPEGRFIAIITFSVVCGFGGLLAVLKR